MQILAVIVDGDGGDKLPKWGGREAFMGGRIRHNDRCVSGSTVVGGEYRRWQGLRKRSREMQSYSLLYPSGPGGWRTLVVAEAVVKAEAKGEIGANSEEVK